MRLRLRAASSIGRHLRGGTFADPFGSHRLSSARLRDSALAGLPNIWQHPYSTLWRLRTPGLAVLPGFPTHHPARWLAVCAFGRVARLRPCALLYGSGFRRLRRHSLAARTPFRHWPTCHHMPGSLAAKRPALRSPFVGHPLVRASFLGLLGSLRPARAGRAAPVLRLSAQYSPERSRSARRTLRPADSREGTGIPAHHLAAFRNHSASRSAALL